MKHPEFIIPASDQSDAFAAALEALPEAERQAIKRNGELLIVEIQMKRGGAARLGMHGALELLAKLGIWLDDNPAVARRVARWGDNHD